MAYAAEHLPHYMIPYAFIQVTEFPYTPNKKLDRKALAAMDLPQDSLTAVHSLMLPQSDTEKAVYSVWKAILEKDGFGCNQDFFHVGGNSLLLILMLSELKKQYPAELSVADLYECRTVQAIAQFIDESAGRNSSDAEAGSDDPEQTAKLKTCMLSGAQLRLYLLEQMDPVRCKYNINIGMDTIAFIDDQIFEREEVAFQHPEVLCLDAADIERILEMDAFHPTHLTADAKNRRQLYQNDIKRNQLKEKFKGTETEFLESLEMRFTVSHVGEDDLARAEELTVRTHQLNATGVTYSYEELERFSKDDNYIVLIAQLEDKYGDYGKIGLALIEKQKTAWTLKLLLMSCRVMSRGVGTVLLNYISGLAIKNGVDLYAEFIPTDRNKIMYITYKFAGYHSDGKNGEIERLKLDQTKAGKIPDYLTLVEGDLLHV